MIVTILKILVIAGMIIAILATIPDLFTPITAMIDDLFNLNLESLLNNIYDTIPSDLMTLIQIGLSALIITIVISWFVGGSDD